MNIPWSCPDCGRDPWGGYPPVAGRGGGLFVPCGCLLSGRLAKIKAEEEDGRRRLGFCERRFTNPELEAVYSDFPEPGGLAVQPHLSAADKRARELEAHGYYLWTPRLLRGFFGPVRGKMAEDRFFMYRAEAPDDVPAPTIRAVRCVIEEMEPPWVEAVAEARHYADDARVIAAWCEIPVQAVLAALDVLRRREEAAS
jgi:hypothetical protein